MNEVALSWSLADGDAGAGVADATAIYVVTSTANEPDRIERIDAAVESATLTGLKNGVEYAFTVYAATADGRSVAEGPAVATPTTGADGEVAGLIVAFTDSVDVPVGSTDVPGADAVEQVGLEVTAQVTDDAMLVALSEPVTLDAAQTIAADLQQSPDVAWAEPDIFLFTATTDPTTSGTDSTIPTAGTNPATATTDPSADPPVGNSGTTSPTTTSGSALAQAVSVPADSSYADQWNLWDTYGIGVGDGNSRMTDAWAGGRGAGATVAVIDTGITPHADLDANLVPGYDFVSNPPGLAADRDGSGTAVDFDADTTDPARFGAAGRDDNPTDPGDWRGVAPTRDSSWHGTAMAGIIAAAESGNGTVGVAPEAKIEPIRALSWRGGLLSDIAAGITWASGGTVTDTPANAHPADVINMSFAVQSSCPVALQAAISDARARGTVLVAAAGNANADAAGYAPGNCDGVITVAATGRDGQRAGYSNYGARIDLSAPGGSNDGGAIIAPSNAGTREPTPEGEAGGTDGGMYRGQMGTSVAAAHVSGAIALLKARNKNLSPDEIETALTGSVRPFANDTFDTDPAKTGGTGILRLGDSEPLAQIAAACFTSNPYVISTGYRVEYWTTNPNNSSCSTTWTAPTAVSSVEYLVVAGGGGGGGAYQWNSGGGGAGGLRAGSLSVSGGTTYSVAVGGGGDGGTAYANGNWTVYSSVRGGNGGNSTFAAVSATGGGGGSSGSIGTAGTAPAGNGGSGGGGSAQATYVAGMANGSTTDSSQGNNGSQGQSGGGTQFGGGGGGRGSAGSGQSGGSGYSSNITGSSTTYATGGWGGTRTPQTGNGGAGTPATGAGGGGAGGNLTYGVDLNGFTGGAGGSGIVVVRYAVPLAPTLSSVVASAGNTATLTWTAPSNAGSIPVTGYQIAYTPSGGGTSVVNVSSSASPYALSGLTPNTTYSFAVTANSAVGYGVQSNSVNQFILGPTTKFKITGTASQAAGVTQSLTVTAQDAYGNTTPFYTGSKSITFSGASLPLVGSTTPTVTNASGTAVAFGTATTLTFAATGIASVSGSNNGVMTLVRAETAYIVATDGAITTSGTDRLTVTVTNTTASRMVVNAGDNQSAIAGAAVATVPSVLITDVYGNPFKTSNVTVTFAVASGGGSITTTSATTALGIANCGSWTLGKVVGTNTLTATYGSVTGSPITFTANGIVGPAVKLQVLLPGETAAPGTVNGKTGTPTTRLAGVALSVRVNAVDANWNVAPTATPTVALTTTSPLKSLAPNTALVAGTTLLSATLYSAGSWTFTATDTASSAALTANTSPLVVVEPGTPTQYDVTLSTTTPVAGALILASAQLEDTWGNSVPTPGRVVVWSASATGGAFGTSSSHTNSNGVATVGYTTPTTPGTAVQVIATDTSSLTGTSPSLTTLSGAICATSTSTSTPYRVVRVLAPGTCDLSVPVKVKQMEYLVVGGGGGGGAGNGGGGGGGAVVASSSPASTTPGGSIVVAVGDGGAAGSANGRGGDGGASSISGAGLSASAAGGGAGGGYDSTAGGAGASGGGGAGKASGYGTGGAGSAGGTGGSPGGDNRGGGGGGASPWNGGNGSGTTGGTGGVGKASSITGTSVTYGGGGGGGGQGAGGSVGAGGGGAGGTGTTSAGVAGTANTGGGGGGSGDGLAQPGGAGGSGVVTLRYYSYWYEAYGPLTFEGTAGAALNEDLPTVLVTNSVGQPLAGVTVTFTVAVGGGSATGTSAVTAANGRATVGSWTMGPTAGTNMMTASVANAGGSSITFTAFAASTTPAALVFVTGTDPSAAVGVAGAAFPTTPKVKVVDSAGRRITTSTASIAAAASGGTLGGTTTVSAVNGIATFSTMTFGGATWANGGRYALTFTSGALPALVTSQFAPATAGTATTTQVLLPGQSAAPGTVNGRTGTPTVQTAGVSFNATVNATDAWWNIDATATPTVAITSSDGGAVLPPDAALGAGTGTFPVTLTTAGSQTVTATDQAGSSPITANTSAAVTVNAGPAAQYDVTLSSATPVAGASVTVTAQLDDAYGNDVSTAGKVITWSASAGGGSFGAATSTTNASGVATVSYATPVKAGVARTVTATDDTTPTALVGTSAALTTQAGTATRLQVLLPGETADPGSVTGKTGSPTNATAGTAVSVTVNAVDANWNVVSAATPTVAITSSDANATLPANAALVAGTGTFAVTFKTAGSRTATATWVSGGTSLTADTSAAVTIDADVAAQLQVLLPGETAAPGTSTGKTGSPTAATVGTPVIATVNAVDAYWNVVAAATPTVAITSSDANAALPADAALVAGTGTFSVTFKTAGSRTVTATDTTSSSPLTAGTSAAVTVNVGTAVKLQILLPGETAAPGTSTGKTGTPTAQAAGTAMTATVNAVDAHWNVVTSTATVAITSSDPNATLPANAALVAGTKTFNVTFKTAGTRTLTATWVSGGSSLTADTSSAVTVDPGAAVKLQVLLPGETAAPGTTTGKTGSPTAATAGAAVTATVNAVDANWNVVPTATPTVAITSSDANAVLPADAALVAGTGTFAVDFHTAGSRTVTATDTAGSSPLTAGVSATVTVDAGAATKLQVLLPGETAAPGTSTGKTGTPTSQTAGTAVTATVRAVDAFWNLVTSATPTVAITSSDANAVLPADAVLVAGTKTFQVTFKTAGSQTVTATDTAVSSPLTSDTSSALTVSPAAAAKLQTLLPGETAAPGTVTGKTGTPTSQTAGTAVSVTVNAVDAYWNVVSSATPTVAMTSSDANATLPASAALVAGTGTFAVTVKTAGSRTVTATDQASSGGLTASTSAAVTVDPDAVVALQVLLPGETAAPGTSTGKTGTPTAQAAGVAMTATVNAVDAYWNLVSSATPTVAITSNDANAVLPADAALVAGTGTFQVEFRTAGSRTVTATDTAGSSPLTASTSAAVTVSAGGATKLQVLLPGETAAPGTVSGKTGTPTAQTAGTAMAATVNAVDDYWNVVPTATLTVAITSSDANATLPANAALVAGTKTVQITFKTTGSWTVTATWVSGGSSLTASTSSAVTVDPGAVVKLQVLLPGETAAPGTATGKTGTPTAQTAGTAMTATVNAVDAFWNLVSSATPTVGITSSDANATLPADAALVAGTGAFAVTFKTAGSRTVTATDQASSGALTTSTSAAVTVDPDAAVALQVLLPGESAAPGTVSGKTGTPTAQTAGVAVTATVNAVDAFWNVVPSATPTVAITSSDANATLPSNAALVAGTKSFAVTFKTAGSRTVTATDQASSSPLATSTSAPVTVDPAAAAKLLVLLPGETAAPGTSTGKTGTPTTQTAGVAMTATVNAVDAFWNLVPTATPTVAMTSTDANAVLPANAALVSGTGTFQVEFRTAGSRTVTATDTASSGALTASTSAAVAVDAAAAARLQVLLPGETAAPGTSTGKTGTPTTQAAGASVSATVNAVDAFWNVVPTATPTVAIASADVNATLPADAALVAGTGTFAVTFKTAGSWTVTATDQASSAALTASTSASVTVTPGLATKLQVLLPGETSAPGTATGKAGSPTAQTAGVAMTATVNAVDAYWNVVPTATPTVAITSSDANATLPANAALVAGTKTVQITFKTTGSWTVTATDQASSGALTASTSAAVTVDPAAAVKLQVLLPGESAAPGTATGKTGSPTSQPAGATVTATVNAVDAYWNIVSTATPTVAITTTDPNAVLPNDAALVAGTGIFQVEFHTAGSRTLTATDTASSSPLTASTSAVVTVTPGPASKLQILLPGQSAAPGTSTGKTGSPSAATAGVAVNVTVNAVDDYWNVVPTATPTVAITASDANATLPSNAALVAGSKTFAVTFKTAGSWTVTATDQASSSPLTAATSAAVTVDPAAAAQLQVLVPGETAAPGTATGKTGTPTSATVGSAVNVTVNAVDAFWNVVPTATPTVAITSTDTLAMLPANTALVAGTATLPVTFKMAGSWTVTATDQASSSPLTASTSPAITVDPAAAAKLQILLPGETAAPGTATGKTGTPTAQPAGAVVTVRVNAVDDYWNVVMIAAPTIAITSSDLNAVLPPDATLVGGTGTFAVTFKTAGTRTVTASDTASSSPLTPSTSAAVTVNPATVTKLQVLLPGETAAPGTTTGKTGSPTNATAGSAVNVTVNAVDAYWNIVPTATPTVAITASDANATLPSNAPLVAGTGSFQVTFKTVGARTVTATDQASSNALTAGTSVSVLVTPGTVVKLQTLLPGETAAPGTATGKTGTPTQQTAGTAMTATINAVDAYFNLVASATPTIAVTSSDTHAVLPADTTLVAGTGTVSLTFRTAGSWTVTASDTAASSALTAGTSAAVSVTPGSSSKLQVLMPGETAAPGTATGKTGTPTNATAGTAVNVVVNAVDANWNTVTTATPTVAITSSDANATLPANAALVAGTKTFAVTFKTAGSWTVTATDTASSGALTASTSAPVTVGHGSLAAFVLSASTGTLTAGGTAELGITAQDAYGNTVTAYTGSHALTFSGLSVSPGGTAPTVTNDAGTAVALGSPTAITFSNGVAGVSGSANGVLTAVTAQTAGLTVTDATGSTAVTSNTVSLAVGPASAMALVVSQQPGALTNQGDAFSPAVTVTAEDTYGNVATTTPLTVDVALGLPATGELGGTLTRSTVAGVATFTGLTYNGKVAPATQSLVFSTTNPSLSVTSSTFTVTNAESTVTGYFVRMNDCTTSLSAAAKVAGTAYNVCVIAHDRWNNTTSAANGRSLTLTSTALPAGQTFTATIGSTGTVNGIAFTPTVADAGRRIAVTDGTVATANASGLFDVDPGTPALIVGLPGQTLSPGVVGGLTGTVSASLRAGVGFAATVYLADGYGNLVDNTGAAATIALTRAAGTGTLTAMPATMILGGSTATFTGVTYTKAESGVQLTATGSGPGALAAGKTGTSVAFTVLAGPVDAATSTLALSPLSIPANGTSTATLTVQAKDAQGNNLAVGGESVVITRSGTGAGVLGTVVDHNNGTYTATVTAPTAFASNDFTATINGSPVQDGAPSPTSRTLTYTALSQTITFTQSLPTATYTDPAFGLVATASSALPVQFTSTTTGVCTTTGTNGATLSIVGAGTCSITVSQAGNTQYDPATDVVRTFTVNLATQTITFGALATKTYGDPAFTVAATATSALPVQFTSTTTGVCTTTGTNGATVTILAAGTCSVTASQAGNSNWNPASDVVQAFTVDKAAQAALTITSANTVPFSDTLTLTTAGGSGTGTVSFAVTTAGTAGCVISVVGGVSTLATTGNAGTSCGITATRAGDANWLPTSTTQTITVVRAPNVIAFGTLANKTFVDPSFTVGASATSGLPVTFATTTPAVCSVFGTLVTINAAGTCTVVASQAQSTNYVAAVDVPQSFTVAPATQTPVTMSSASTVAYGQTLTLAAVGGSGSGGLTFAVTAGTCTITIPGANTATLNPGDAGSLCQVQATKVADSNWLAADSAVQTITVAKAGQVLSFTTPTPLWPVVGGTFTPTAVSTSTATSQPSGLTPSLAVATGSASVCTMTGGVVSFLTNGSCVIEATSTGSANFLAAPTASQTIAVGLRNQNITFAQPSGMTFGASSAALTAQASSGLRVVFTGTTPSVCDVSALGVVTSVAAGACEVVASQPGDLAYAPASPVTRSFIIAPALPTAPTLMSAAAGDASATVAFAPPSSTGGVPVVAYEVVATPVGGGTPVSTTACPPSVTPLACTVGGLANGTAYTLTVAAVNSAGTGPASSPSSSLTPAGAPFAVTALTVEPGDTVLTVSWTPLTTAQLNGGTFTEYAVSSRVTGTSTWMPWTTLTAQSANGTTITGVVNGTAYDVQVVALTSANSTVWTGNTATASQYPSTVPSAPRALQALAPTITTMQVSWQTPASDGGAALTPAVTGGPLYVVTITSTDPNAGSPVPPCVFANANDRFCDVTGLTDGALYTVSVQAHNRMGLGAAATTQFIPAASDATLSDLVVETGTTPVPLSPAFASSTLGYTASVANNVTDVTVTPTVTSPGASVSVDGVGVVSTEPSPSIPLRVGTTTIAVKVVASNPAFTRTYTIVITRAGLPPVPDDGGGGLAPIPVNPGAPATGPVVVDGLPIYGVELTRNHTDSGWDITGPGFGMTLSTVSATDRPMEMTQSGVMRVPDGGAIAMTGNGFRPGSPVTVFAIPVSLRSATVTQAAMRAAIVELGVYYANEYGEVSETIVVDGVDLGQYVLQVNGFTPLLLQRSVSLRMDVVAGTEQRAGVARGAGFFAARSATFTVAGRNRLDAIVDAVPADAEDTRVSIIAVSLSMGTPGQNVRMASQRAQAIVDHLVDRGLKGEYDVIVKTSFTVDGAERAARALSTDPATPDLAPDGRPLTTATVTFTAPHPL